MGNETFYVEGLNEIANVVNKLEVHVFLLCIS